MRNPTNWAGMIPRRPLKTSPPEPGTGTPATAAAGSERGGFEGLAARTYTARRESRQSARQAAVDPWATSATGQDQGAMLADLAAKVYRKRAAERAAFRERAADDAFRLATERGPDGGPWGQR